MIRVFNHYISLHVALQMMFDFGFVLLAMVAFGLLQLPNLDLLMSMTAPYGFSVAAGTFVVNNVAGIYQNAPNRTLQQSVARALIAITVMLPLAYLICSWLDMETPAGMTLTYSAMGAVLAVIAHRVYAAHFGEVAVVRPRILILGTGRVAQQVADSLRVSDPRAVIAGYVASPNDRDGAVPASQILAGSTSLAATAAQAGVDEIVVALTERRSGSMSLRDLLECKIHGIRVSDISTHFEKRLGQIKLDYVNAGWLIFGDGFNQGFVRTAVKRLFDLTSACVLLVVGLPLMLLTALLIKLDSPGPVFYRQERVGLNGETFRVIKFRSMRADAERDGKPRWAAAGDDRITRIGRLIRLVRIDELPQLFNVLTGDMSLVGPRPERPFFVDSLTQDIPYYAVRHSVKPGVTGWAQVRYEYGSTVEDARQKLQYDLYYVKNHTLFLDLLIMFETISVVLTGKGAR